jgi:hypothetical protein
MYSDLILETYDAWLAEQGQGTPRQQTIPPPPTSPSEEDQPELEDGLIANGRADLPLRATASSTKL